MATVIQAGAKTLAFGVSPAIAGFYDVAVAILIALTDAPFAVAFT